MKALHVVSWITFLLTATASPELPSKGKYARILDAQRSKVKDIDLPRFAEPMTNITVTIGKNALLSCVVENLKGYKVAWVRVDTQTILSIHHNVISQNNRISLTYTDHRSWYLHIKHVEESDRGWYMCQINTDPMRSRKVYLQVVVPPTIVDSTANTQMVVREGNNATLWCKARGSPQPYVMWRREDGEEMLIGGEHVNIVDGEYLFISKVSRLHMAAYLCVASNGIPPSTSNRVYLYVQFPPMLSIPNQLEGAYLGQDVILECHCEAYPASINYWTTEAGDMIISDAARAGDKYETTSITNGYTKHMKLKIRNVGPKDFGTYRCVAKNSLGETDGNIKLDELPAPKSAISIEEEVVNRSLDGKRRNNKIDLNALPDYGVEEWRDGAGNENEVDSNQTPVRNPPGAYHNSAGALAQHNLLGNVIHGIKMQSFGIFRRLSSYLVEAAISNARMLQIKLKQARTVLCLRLQRTFSVAKQTTEKITAIYAGRRNKNTKNVANKATKYKTSYTTNILFSNENSITNNINNTNNTNSTNRSSSNVNNNNITFHKKNNRDYNVNQNGGINNQNNRNNNSKYNNNNDNNNNNINNNNVNNNNNNNNSNTKNYIYKNTNNNMLQIISNIVAVASVCTDYNMQSNVTCLRNLPPISVLLYLLFIYELLHLLICIIIFSMTVLSLLQHHFISRFNNNTFTIFSIKANRHLKAAGEIFALQSEINLATTSTTKSASASASASVPVSAMASTSTSTLATSAPVSHSMSGSNSYPAAVTATIVCGDEPCIALR